MHAFVYIVCKFQKVPRVDERKFAQQAKKMLLKIGAGGPGVDRFPSQGDNIH